MHGMSTYEKSITDPLKVDTIAKRLMSNHGKVGYLWQTIWDSSSNFLLDHFGGTVESSHFQGQGNFSSRTEVLLFVPRPRICCWI
jgi:hypothetical protein